MAKWMITCKEATAFISKKEERKLSTTQQIQLWMHLGICGLCKLFAKQNKIIINITKNSSLDIYIKLSEKEKQLIIDKLNQ